MVTLRRGTMCFPHLRVSDCVRVTLPVAFSAIVLPSYQVRRQGGAVDQGVSLHQIRAGATMQHGFRSARGGRRTQAGRVACGMLVMCRLPYGQHSAAPPWQTQTGSGGHSMQTSSGRYGSMSCVFYTEYVECIRATLPCPFLRCPCSAYPMWPSEAYEPGSDGAIAQASSRIYSDFVHGRPVE